MHSTLLEKNNVWQILGPQQRRARVNSTALHTLHTLLLRHWVYLASHCPRVRIYRLAVVGLLIYEVEV